MELFHVLFIATEYGIKQLFMTSLKRETYCERNKGLCGIYDKDKILKHQFFCAIEYVFTFFFFFFFNYSNIERFKWRLCIYISVFFFFKFSHRNLHNLFPRIKIVPLIKKLIMKVSFDATRYLVSVRYNCEHVTFNMVSNCSHF